MEAYRPQTAIPRLRAEVSARARRGSSPPRAGSRIQDSRTPVVHVTMPDFEETDDGWEGPQPRGRHPGSAWHGLPDGSYAKRRPREGEEPRLAQEILIRRAEERGRDAVLGARGMPGRCPRPLAR